MGKGFNNYMCKKFFHPASRDNLKRVWMAEQKSEAYRKRQDELRMQYEKEQDLYNNRALLSKESKDKLSVNFLYEPPPGAKKEREREDDEPEYKFEWQRKYNAPREDYCKNNSEIRDQPFGILVRNVRCIKCHKWGHINTDRECPLFNQTPGTSEEQDPIDAQSLVQQMRDDGLALKKSAMSAQQHIQFPSQNMIDSDEDEEGTNKIQADEIEFLKNLSTKQKQKLLRKLEKLEKKNREKKKKAKKNGKRDANGNISESGSSYEEDKSKTRKKVIQTDKERKSAKKIQNEFSSSGQESDNYRDKRKVRDKKKGEERSNGNVMKASRREQMESHSREPGSNHVGSQSPSSKKIKRERRNSDVDCEPSYRERRSRSVENRLEPHVREYSSNHNRRQSPYPERLNIKQERRDTDSDSESSYREQKGSGSAVKGTVARSHVRSSNHKNGRSSSPLRKKVHRDQRHTDTDSEPTYKGRRRSRSVDKSRDKRRNDHTELKRRRRSTSRDHR